MKIIILILKIKLDSIEKSLNNNKINVIYQKEIIILKNTEYNDVELFKKIKKFVIGNLEYNTKTKEILAKIF